MNQSTRKYFDALIFFIKDQSNGIVANTTGIRGIVCIGEERDGDERIFVHTDMSESEFFSRHSKDNPLNTEDFYAEKPL